MKKILFFTLFITTLFATSNEFQNKKVFSEKEAKELLNDFIGMTGESQEKFNKMISITIKDENWQKASNSFYIKKNSVKLVKGAKQEVKIPDWKEALKFYKQSVIKSDNTLSAYQGLSLINQFFMFMDSSNNSTKSIKEEILDEYIPIFAEVLKKRGYCYGYTNLMKYEGNYNKNYEKALIIGNEGLGICKKQLSEKKIPSWLEMNYRKDFVRIKNIKKLKDEGKIIIEADLSAKTENKASNKVK